MDRVLILFVVALVSGVTFGAGVSNISAATTQDFSISTYDIVYELAKDAKGRSTLKTVETITAEFPNDDQNHGLERALPNRYDGHPTSLRVESVTDAQGAPLEYATYSSDGLEVLRIGSADTYVHGTKTYRITYTQRDVTRY